MTRPAKARKPAPAPTPLPEVETPSTEALEQPGDGVLTLFQEWQEAGCPRTWEEWEQTQERKRPRFAPAPGYKRPKHIAAGHWMRGALATVLEAAREAGADRATILNVLRGVAMDVERAEERGRKG